jgi:hypothetical protein
VLSSFRIHGEDPWRAGWPKQLGKLSTLWLHIKVIYHCTEIIRIAKLWVSICVACLACITKIIIIPAGFLFSDCLDGNKLGDASGESLESVEDRARSAW